MEGETLRLHPVDEVSLGREESREVPKHTEFRLEHDGQPKVQKIEELIWY